MKEQIESIFYSSPLGLIKISATSKGITEIDFINKNKLSTQNQNISNAHLKACINQLDEYFRGERKNFDLKFDLGGTDFQKKVWNQLRKIPFGKTVSYLEVAQKINNPKAVRAVGQAIGKNPVAIIIPCHRVIGSNGKLTGYAGGMWRKEWLLKHEGVL